MVEFKLFAKRSALFLLIGVSLFLGLNARFESQITDREELVYRELFHPKVKANVVILGSSHASVGINPKYLQSEKNRVFNFAFGGADPIFYRHWLSLFWEYYPEPDIVIYQVDWFLWRDVPYLGKQIEHDADFIPLGHLRDLLGQSTINIKDLFLNRFILFQNRQALDKLIWPSYGSKCAPLSSYFQGFSPAVCPSTKPGSIVAAEVPERKEAFLEQMTEFKKRDIEVIWVQTPEFIPGRQFAPVYQSEMEELADQLDIPFFNYNTTRAGPFNNDQNYFIDWAHLNAVGADEFSRRFGQDLSEFKAWKQ